MRHAFRWAASLVLLACGSSAGALDLRVGVGSGCTQATLQAALSAIEGVGGSHNIRINAGTYRDIGEPVEAERATRMGGWSAWIGLALGSVGAVFCGLWMLGVGR